MFATFHRCKADFCANGRNACRVDHNVDQARFQQRFHALRGGDATRFNRGVQRIGGVGGNSTVGVTVSDADRTACGLRVQLTNRADFDAAHMGHAADNVGPHLSCANKTDSHGFSGFSACCQVFGKAGKGDIRGHWGSPRYGCHKISVHLPFCQS